MDDFVNRKCLGIRVLVVGEVMSVEGEKGEKVKKTGQRGREMDGLRRDRGSLVSIHTITRKHRS